LTFADKICGFIFNKKQKEVSMENSKPNILIFMTDQQRGDSVFNDKIPTPNLDRFRSEGLAFKETFCPSPHCCPSRASFFTGLYPTQHGIWNNIFVANALTRTTKSGVGFFSDILKDEGYSMDYTGKWHVSSKFQPGDLGWNLGPEKNRHKTFKSESEMEFETDTNWNMYETSKIAFEDDIRPESEIIRPGYPRYAHYGLSDNPYGDLTTTDNALKMIYDRAESDDDRPFIHYVGLVGPHDPYCVPQEFLDKIDPEIITLPESFYDGMKDKPGFYRRIKDIYNQLSEQEHKDALRHYYAYCSFVDAQFGKVLKALDEVGQKENTLVLYVSDHGDYGGEHGLWTKGLAGFRGAYHIPAVMRWPKGIKNPGRVINEMVSLADFAPTFTELSKSKKSSPHDNLPMAGKSLMPFIRDEKAVWRKELFTQSNGNELYGIQRIVFDDKYKLIFNGFDYDELYDLENDPGEITNLIAEGQFGEYKTIVKSYYKKLWRFSKKSGDQCNNAYINTAYPTYGPGIIYEYRD
jgi:arylsulfatase A-like enzyme